MPETFPLPGGSFKIVRLILIGYLHQGGSARKPVGPGDVGSAIGMGQPEVSRNNAFLAAVGIIEKEGRRWRLTDGGAAVARALEYDADDEIARTLHDLLRQNEFIGQITTYLRGRGPTDVNQLAEHIARAANQPRRPATLRGARTLIEMLLRGRLIADDGGLISVASRAREVITTEPAASVTSIGDLPVPPNVVKKAHVVHVSVQLNLDAAAISTDAKVDALAQRLQRLLDQIPGAQNADGD